MPIWPRVVEMSLRDSIVSRLESKGKQCFPCAAALRELLECYDEDLECHRARYGTHKPIQWQDDDNDNYYACRCRGGFPRENFSLLAKLHAGAFQDVQANVLLFVNQRLPQEVADHIIAATLVAEGTPLPPAEWYCSAFKQEASGLKTLTTLPHLWALKGWT